MLKKKYLKDPSAVIQALKEGHVLMVKDGRKGCIYMQDGMIVKKNNNGYHINCTINEIEKPYYFIENPLKIEEDKFYKTRDGRKAYCCIVEENKCFFAIAGHVPFITDKAGNYKKGKKSGFDIVDYWEK